MPVGPTWLRAAMATVELGMLQLLSAGAPVPLLLPLAPASQQAWTDRAGAMSGGISPGSHTTRLGKAVPLLPTGEQPHKARNGACSAACSTAAACFAAAGVGSGVPGMGTANALASQLQV